MPRLLVLGASGRCGKWMVRIAAERGHEVTAAIRPESDPSFSRAVRVARGSVLDAGFLDPLLGEHDVVLSGLGLRRASVFPWSRLLSPPDLVEQVSRRVVSCPASAHIRRFLWVSAGGVGDSRECLSFPIRCLIGAGSVGLAYADLEAAESILARSSIASLAVRPVTLMPGAPTGRATAVGRYGLLSRIRPSDVALWMVDVADGTRTWEEETILLGTGSRLLSRERGRG